MNKIYYLIAPLLMLGITSTVQASETLEIRVNEEKECTDKTNLKHFKEIEKTQNVKVWCIFQNKYYTTDGKHESKDLQVIEPSGPSYATKSLDPKPRPSSQPPKPKIIEPKYVEIKTYFATDRASTGNVDPYKAFNHQIYKGERPYQLGTAKVTVPLSKRLGISSKPGMLTFTPDPSKHTLLKSSTLLTPDDFFKDIHQNSTKQAFIFIHGYNVNFSSAAMQTAELVYDLNFKGTPIFYSWPSQAKIMGYFADQKTIVNTQPKFAQFIESFLQEAPQDLYLVAHSMGSVALLKTLKEELPRQAALQQHLKGIIFVAPDVPTAQFNQTLTELSQYQIPVTLYGSQRDLALTLSKTLSAHQRAGSLDPVDGLLDIHGLEVIDATNVRTDFLGHGLSPMTIDMSELILHRTKANLRTRLKQMMHPKGTYFILNRY